MADSAVDLDEYTKLWKELWANKKTGWHLKERNP